MASENEDNQSEIVYRCPVACYFQPDILTRYRIPLAAEIECGKLDDASIRALPDGQTDAAEWFALQVAHLGW